MRDITFDELTDTLYDEVVNALTPDSEGDARAVVAHCVLRLVDDPNDWNDVIGSRAGGGLMTSSTMQREHEQHSSRTVIACAVCGRAVDTDSAHFVDGDDFGVLGQVELHPECCPDCTGGAPSAGLDSSGCGGDASR